MGLGKKICKHCCHLSSNSKRIFFRQLKKWKLLKDSVVHEPSTETFYISFKSGAKAFINYKVEKNDTIDLWHTEVPDEGRGKGIGGFLASKSIKDLAAANSS